MNTIIFYRQVRENRGCRTGIEVNGYTVFERFEKGAEDDSDPALLWYVDIRCEGQSLPEGADQARQWLLKHGVYVREGLTQLADKMSGIDVGDRPLQWRVPNVPEGTQIVVVCSALRRIEGLEFAAFLRGVGNNWESLVQAIPAARAFVQ